MQDVSCDWGIKQDERTVDPEEVSPDYEVIVGTDKSRAGRKKPGQKPMYQLQLGQMQKGVS